MTAPADQLRPRFEKLGRLMDEAEHDVLAYMTFAAQHRTKLHSTNPLERLNKEVKRQPTSSASSRVRNPSCGSSAPFSWSTTTIGRRKIATCRSRASQRAGRKDCRPQAVADYTQGGLTNEPLSYTRQLHHIDGRDPRRGEGVFATVL